MRYHKPCPINDSHKTDSFNSGVPSLDDWLKNMARYNQEQGYTKTFVIADEQGNVVGYYALCAAMIHRADVSRNIKGGRAPTEIPVALIARMAVDSNHQKQKLGSALLRNALLNVVSAAQAVAFRAVVVHAIDKKAESFYRYHGFSDTKGMEGRLILSTKDILQSVDAVCNTKAKS